MKQKVKERRKSKDMNPDISSHTENSVNNSPKFSSIIHSRNGTTESENLRIFVPEQGVWLDTESVCEIVTGQRWHFKNPNGVTL